MKKILAIFLTAAMAVGMTSCGKKNKITESDMNAIEGQALEEVKTDDTSEAEDAADESEPLEEAEEADENQPQSAATIDEFDIAIGDAKLIDSVDGRAVVIEFTFKNNTTHPKSFDGIFDETVTQDGKELLGATVVDKVAGFDPLSAVTEINGGDTATVQKAYALDDETTDITVTAYRYAEPDHGIVTKTFKLN